MDKVIKRQINTYHFFDAYGWSYYFGKRRWGNTRKLWWLAKIIHILNGDKYFTIKF